MTQPTIVFDFKAKKVTAVGGSVQQKALVDVLSKRQGVVSTASGAPPSRDG